jgi:hypothetical protein
MTAPVASRRPTRHPRLEPDERRARVCRGNSCRHPRDVIAKQFITVLTRGASLPRRCTLCARRRSGAASHGNLPCAANHRRAGTRRSVPARSGPWDAASPGPSKRGDRVRAASAARLHPRVRGACRRSAQRPSIVPIMPTPTPIMPTPTARRGLGAACRACSCASQSSVEPNPSRPTCPPKSGRTADITDRQRHGVQSRATDVYESIRYAWRRPWSLSPRVLAIERRS